ncbi:ArnT family glycosyltransferase [Maricaulis sp. CAU 1757]
MASLATGLRAYWIIGLVAAVSALAGIFTMPPLDRDESRFAQATAQMIETGDFVSINFLDESRNKKPVGIHWLQAASVSVFSDAAAREIWAYRLPSLLGVVLAALACFWGGVRLVGREAAFAGSLLFASCVLLGIEGGIAKTDAMLAGCTTLAMAALANLRSGGARRSAMLFWLAVGLGVLIKGPVTPMVAGLAAIVLVVWERKAAWLKPLLFWPGPLLAIVLVLPWLIGIQIATDGAFLRDALGDDLGPKLVSGHERHGGLPGYHLLLLPLLFFPASLFLVPGGARLLSHLRDDRASDTARAARFLLAWAVPTWLVFELLPTKLPHYVLPAYPALALIAGWGGVELARTAAWQRWTSWVFYAVGALLFAVALPAIFFAYATGASWDAVQLAGSMAVPSIALSPDPSAIARVLLAATVFAGLAGATLAVAGLRRSTVALLVLAVLSGLGWQVLGRGVAAPAASAVRLADQVRGLHDRASDQVDLDGQRLVSASSFTEPSLVFSLGTDTVLGSAQDVLAFAESRQVPTFVVLDLSRDDDLRAAWLGTAETDETDWTEYDFFARLEALGACRRAYTSGTNYSRGDEVLLVTFLTRCGTDVSIEELDYR